MKKFLIVLLVIVAGSTVAWKLATPTYTYRYRLTVEIDTPDGVKSGSSVIEVKTEKAPDLLKIMSAGGANKRISGEAIYIDLGGEKNLFAVLDGDLLTLAPSVFLGEEYVAKNGWIKTAQVLSSMKHSSMVLPTSRTPTLVTFKNLKDPHTLIPVYFYDEEQDGTSKTINNFEGIFGGGYELLRAEIALTDDPMKQKIDHLLPWVTTQKGYLVKSAQHQKIKSISALDFKKGFYHDNL